MSNPITMSLYAYFGKSARDLKQSVPNRKPYLGIRFPNLKKYAQTLIKSDFEAFLVNNDLSIYELEILQTYVIGSIKEINQAVMHFDGLATKAKEWSVVDALCQKFVIAKKYPKHVWKLIATYAKIDDEYMQRIAAVLILSHFLNDQFVDSSVQILVNLKHSGYFTKMAVAWAVSTLFVKYPKRAMAILKNHQLDDWTHRKAIQKALESYRVSEDDKHALKQLIGKA